MSGRCTLKQARKSLFKAACLGDLETATFLVAQKTNLNAKTSMGATALMGAAQNGRLDVVRYLVKNGAEIDLPTTLETLP